MKMIDGVVSIVHSDGVNIEIEHKELVMCKNCKYMTDCFSEVAMTDQYQLTTIFEPIEWCSKGERKEG